MSDARISGRVVAITGGACGIGRAAAKALLASGASVVVGDIDEERLDAVRDELGPRALAAHLDVSDPASFAAFLDRAESELGPLDVMVNNAGIMPIGPFVDETNGQAQRVIAVNVLGPLYGTRLALQRMLPRGRGHVINVASAAGRAPVPGAISYGASKAAVVSLTESARVEHAGSGIAFTCVMPSFTATELVSGTKGTRFVPTVAAEDVASAIVAVIERPRCDVFVPRTIGSLLRVQQLIGRRLRDATNRVLGADTTFLDIDHTARAMYERRLTDGAAEDRVR